MNKVITLLLILVGAYLFVPLNGLKQSPTSLQGWWITPDQKGNWWFNQGIYDRAAKAYDAPFKKGMAYYRLGEFKQAASYFGYVNSADAVYNRGNALLMSGLYQEAIVSYQQALEKQPDWPVAKQNLEIAQNRLSKLKRKGGEGTGGKLGADGYVFGSEKRVNTAASAEQLDDDGAGLSEEAQQQGWLSRVKPSPSRFLSSRFAYQLSVSNRKVGSSDEMLQDERAQ